MKISIITATFNSAETVRDTFDSILGQTYPDYECVVVDGGSTDGTVDIIKEYEPRFRGRMRWNSEPDKGIYDAMNKGISLASGDVVGILNSDDFYTSGDVLQVVADELRKCPELDAVYGDVHYVDRKNLSKTVRYYSSKLFRRNLMRMGFMPAHPSFYCRREVYERFVIDGGCFFDTTYKVAADFEILLRMIYVGGIKTQYVRKDFVTMRTGGASSSGMESHTLINVEHLRALKENGVYSNIFLLSLRYFYKVGELIDARIRKVFRQMNRG